MYYTYITCIAYITYMNIREMREYANLHHLKVYGDRRLRTTWAQVVLAHQNKSIDGYTISLSQTQCKSQSRSKCTHGCVYHPKETQCLPMTDTHRKYCRCQLHVGAQQFERGHPLHPYAICKASTRVKGVGTNYCYRHYDLARLDSKRGKRKKYNHEQEWRVLKELHSK